MLEVLAKLDQYLSQLSDLIGVEFAGLGGRALFARPLCNEKIA
jgi:hypothetical protein